MRLRYFAPLLLGLFMNAASATDPVRVQLTTSKGVIELELNAEKAPERSPMSRLTVSKT